jgi:hypothetical protein
MRAKVWLTTNDLAERLRTVPGTVRYWRYAGVGPRGVKIGRRVLYDLTEVERWESGTTAARPPKPSTTAGQLAASTAVAGGPNRTSSRESLTRTSHCKRWQSSANTERARVLRSRPKEPHEPEEGAARERPHLHDQPPPSR